ncbi:MAG: amino acid adenylation domain-containing protein [Pedosphaera sp.]|nr:amino acid adenylation domain-containing protein [Pedosphaera sp.]
MTDSNQEGIAIIGLTGRFPGAENVGEFWRNLVAGVESISTFSDEELAAAGLDIAAVQKIPAYIRSRGVLKDAECFDAAFFGVNPKEAEATDPQQRVFLEAAWSALESAGYTSENYRGAIGVFAGMSNNSYYLHNLHSRRDVTQLVGWLTTMMGNEKDYLATRVAYKLNLKGPALNIYTACSTSLVAVCQAVQSLQNFQCDMALVGGVSISFPQSRGYQFQDGGITSPDGHCRAFDVNAAGTVFSHGVGVVVLKRLADALADGDEISAVIKGAALNNDGSNKVSFTAPSVDGQAEVIALAQALAGIEPETISYVEAHGTATPLGDPIEVAALTQAFRAKTAKKNFCGLGTVKSNFGHLDVAAGVTGLIKTALALKHKKLPPSLHFTKPNPKLELETSPFHVVNKLTEWKAGATPLRAGVSSFGVGGTNAHVVLEEAPVVEPSGPSRAAKLILLSAKSAGSLEAATANLAAHLKSQPETNLADAAFTLQVGRASFQHRRILVCRDAAEAATVLETRGAKKIFSAQSEAVNPPVVFMFPGQGAQYVNMSREIYESEPSFKVDVDRCAEILQPQLGLDLREVLYPVAEKVSWAEGQLIQTRVTQPALFVIEYALAKLWMSWGIKPAAMIGHSVGEYVAGCLAGVFTLEEGLELVAGRARLVQAQPPGTMLAVRLPEAEALLLLGSQLSIAAINSPNLCVVSGPHAAVEKLEKELEAKKIVGRRLHTSHAFHSAMMDPVLAPFTELLKKVDFKSPQVPYVSNVTAKWVTEKDATDPNYWAGHVRQAVRFADGVGELLNNQNCVMLEVGPGQTLAQLTRQHPAKGVNQTVLSSLATAKEPGAELNSLLTTLGRLWLAGVQPDWEKFYANERRRRVALPTYAFERKKYWVEPSVHEIIPWASPPAGQVIGGAESRVQSPKSRGEAVERDATQDSAEISRKDRILKLLTAQLAELSGMEVAKLSPTASFLELGFDSLFLTQASLAFQNRYGVKVTFRQLLEDLATLADLAAYLDAKLGPDALAATTTAVTSSDARQGTKGSSGIKVSAPAETAPGGQKYFGPFKPIDVGPQGGLTERQQKHLDALIARYTKRTAGSKKTTQEHRAHFADPRAAAGFKHLWKEMVYPIVSARSQGAKIWDVDGNEYVDITLGFGLGFLGHRPPFVVEAIEEQLALGMEIGPASPLAGKVAELMCEFSGLERATFCNTGSEAVTAAIRVTRTVSGRNKIAMFAGAYHGIFDEVLVRPQIVDGELRSIPIAPGIVPDMVNNVIVLEYGSPQALEILKQHGHQIAAVLVEPVQSRRPDFQPREFLHELRRVTEHTGTALVFDETVTGFRCHPGGAQAWFGVKADIATYGKVVGGGLPIGVCCGRVRYMDALDGGHWRYGDASFPEVGVTFFAGTFVRHPLAMASALAVLTHLKEQGPKLQQSLNDKTEKLVGELNSHFEKVGVPIRAQRFSSMFHLTFAPELKYASLLFYHLREKGMHIWEGRPSFLSTVHTEEDVARVVRGFKESVAELQAGGFFPETNRTDGTNALQREVVSLPLTEAQKELWLGAQMGDDASRAFNDSFVIHLRGAPNLELMRETLQLLVDRHDGLRTTFTADGLSQRIAPSLALAIPLTDLSALAAGERERRLAQAVSAMETRPFDLVRGPLIRAEILKLGEAQHALLMATHHLVVDGWSVGVLLFELSKHYSARAQGLACPLEGALQFDDYARWQGGREHATAVSAAEEFWLKKFSDRPAAVELPLDRRRPALKTYRSAQESLAISSEFYKTLKQAAVKERCTLLTYLLASFNVWLYRLTGQETLVVGIPAAGQIAGEVQSLPGNRALVGHCVNLLPMRSECRAEATFAEFLAQSRKETLDAYEHQSLTFGTLVKQMKLPRDPSRVPLVSLTFNVDRAYSGFHLHGLETEIISPPKGFNIFDLGVNIIDFDKELLVDCRFNTDLFDVETIRKWLRDWRAVLESVAAQPEQRLALRPELSDAERQKILVEWNDTAKTFPLDRCVHELFEAQARRTPAAEALVFEEAALTFEQLNRRANQLAHHLIALGVGPEVPVALCVERSLEMIVGLLGILKAGGAYAAMDPTLPVARLQTMLDETRPRALLTHARHVAELPTAGQRVICLDRDWPEIAQQRGTNPASGVTVKDLAYVVFTSGSTGRPKGVGVEHRQLLNYVFGVRERLDLPAGASYATVSTIAADLGNTAIFPPLCFGGSLHVLSLNRAADAKAFADYFRRHRIDCLKIVPSHLTALLAGANPRDVLPRRRLICGGEALAWSLVEQVRRHAPECEVFNHYGPTETTVGVLTNRVERNTVADAATVPLGRPIPNVKIYLLDETGALVPVGVPGEIYVGGAAVARGYLNQPEQTAARFVANPFENGTAARRYRTGDLARYLPDGKVEFLGRVDQQVKVRGFRIELGEIELALRQHADVREAVALAREDTPGDKRLVAYFTANGNIAGAELRNFLKQRLPDYMVPAAIVRLDRLPLTPNGKVDRKALPAPDRGRPELGSGFVAPRTEVEATLAGVWAEVLGVEQLGANDDFFELGGHSLLAAQVAARVRGRYRTDFSLGDFFRAPTIAKMAVAVEEALVAEIAQMSDEEAREMIRNQT